MSDFWKGGERMELDLRESGWNQFISLLSIQKSTKSMNGCVIYTLSDACPTYSSIHPSQTPLPHSNPSISHPFTPQSAPFISFHFISFHSFHFNPTNIPSQSVTCSNQAYAEASFFSEFFFSKYSFDFAILLASRR